MLSEKRYQEILKRMEETGYVTIKDLVDQLQVSESTIRRDLSLLETQNYLTRVHGGAKKVYQLAGEADLLEKAKVNPQAKKVIAIKAAQEIEPNETIFLDAGTTTYQLAEVLNDETVRVVTNGLDHALLCSQKGHQVILIGGQYKASTGAIVGATAIEQMKSYHFNRSFVGMNGIDLDSGLTTPDPAEAALKQAAIRHANRAYVLVDQSKFGQVAFAKVADLDEVTLITQADHQKQLEEFRKMTTILEA